jgi:hypothetical protein
MEDEVISLLNQLLEGQRDMNLNFSRIEKKIDVATEQTTIIKRKIISIGFDIEDMKNDVNAIEIITSKNWTDMEKLKRIKMPK